MASSVSSQSNDDNAAPEPLAETSTTPTLTVSPALPESRTDASAPADEPPRPQAGPLPSKRGEIGFQEGMHDVEAAPDTQASSSSSATLPTRHPADRDHQPVTNRRDSSANDPPPPRSPSRAESTTTTSTADTTGKRSLISFLKRKRIPTVGGLRLTTLALFLFQLCLFGGTLAGWVLIVRRMQHSAASTPPPPPPDPSAVPPNPGADPTAAEDASTGVFTTTSAQIFVHVAFGVVTLAQAIFAERTVFRLRAERYAHVHPGEVLPRVRRGPREGGGVSMGLAPWNRPPLPTYAAALAQAGVGTGDVEDNIIAIPPPPAYGNTRGSTLLLQGFLSDALRAQRPRSGGSTQTRMSGRSRRSAGSAAESWEEVGERPKSYMSTDPEWEARCDADRALVLEETLAQLEEGAVRSRST